MFIPDNHFLVLLIEKLIFTLSILQLYLSRFALRKHFSSVNYLLSSDMRITNLSKQRLQPQTQRRGCLPLCKHNFLILSETGKTENYSKMCLYVIYEWSARSEAAAWCLHCNKKEKVEGETGNKKATIEFYAPCQWQPFWCFSYQGKPIFRQKHQN